VKYAVFRLQHEDGALFPKAQRIGGFSCRSGTKLPFPPTIPELCSFPSLDGKVTLHAAIFRPPNMVPSQAYPLIVHVYGGPHVQLVTQSERLMSNPKLQMLARLGFVVGVCDGRGSARRGLQFEGHIRKRMGQVEVPDQVALVNYLAQQGIADPKRVAISGWSYGGYLSLLALAQRPDVFKISVAGAPVTDWLAYDTGYTERYMDTPANNPKGYEMGSVSHYVNGFPDQENRLKIVHGLIDENVHFVHTATLIQSLTDAQKPYRLMVFPSERHGVRNGRSAAYLEYCIARFLLDYV